jgi:hypothetical protein
MQIEKTYEIGLNNVRKNILQAMPSSLLLAGARGRGGCI